MFRRCEVCHEIAPKTMRCTRCLNGDFCSATCFKKAWPVHKLSCQKPPAQTYWAEASHYEVLGVSKHVDDAALKKAYHSKSREAHPDRNRGDVNAHHKMDRINAAYAVLSDPKQRAAYNREGTKRGLRADGREAASP